MQPVKIQRYFEKYLVYLIGISMALGIFFGIYFPARAPALKPWVPFTLFLMLYPMMIGIQIEQITKAVKNSRLIIWSIVLNFFVSPLIGFLVARLLLGRLPDFAVALILLAATPCAGMVAGWTGMAKGNVALSLVIVSLSLVLSIITIPFTMLLLAGAMVKVDVAALFQGTLLVILIPIILGDITRRLIIHCSGEPGFMRVRPLLPPVSMLGMFAIIFISMALGAQKILTQWQSIFIILVSIVIFYFLQMVISIRLSKKFEFNPADEIALVYSVIGKNVSLAVGLAAQFFSPLTVAMLAINPLVQAPAMAWFLRWSRKTLLKKMPAENS